MFFQCFFSRRIWRASYLGFDFETGTPVPFKEWLAEEGAKQGCNLGFHFCLVDHIYGVLEMMHCLIFLMPWLVLQNSKVPAEKDMVGVWIIRLILAV